MSSPVPNSSRGRTLAAVGVFANISLAAVKLIAGLVGNSYALVGDAVESLADIVGSIIIWGALRWGAIPADDDHPYGHGRAEALAALAVGVIIFLAGIGIGVESIHAMFSPRSPAAPWTLIVLLAVVGVKETLFRVVRRASRQSGSTAVEVDAWHHRMDAITSASAAVGIAASWLGGPEFAKADNWAAVVTSFIIVYNACRLVAGPWNELMDRLPAAITGAVREAALKVEEVRGVEKLHARKSGSVYYVDLHLEVDPAMTVADAHKVSGRVKARIRTDVPSVANVLIHVEPAPDAGRP